MADGLMPMDKDDIAALMQQARMEIDDPRGQPMLVEAMLTLIEQQAKRIATLETCDEYLAIPVKRELDEAKARIAELETSSSGVSQTPEAHNHGDSSGPHMGLVNPDGPAAATALERLAVENEGLKEKVDRVTATWADLEAQRDAARADVERLKAALKHISPYSSIARAALASIKGEGKC